MEVLIRICDHFIHHVQPRLRGKEKRNPGSVLRSARLKTIYRRQYSVRALVARQAKKLALLSGRSHHSFTACNTTSKGLRHNHYPPGARPGSQY